MAKQTETTENKAASTNTAEATKPTTEATANATTPVTDPKEKQTATPTATKETTQTPAKENKPATSKAKTKKNSKADKTADIFKRNPMRKQVFQTSDGFYFIDKSLAKKHATTLKNKKVEVIAKTQNQPSADESDD